MIVDIFLGIIFGVVKLATLPLTLLPNANFPAAVYAAIFSTSSYLATANQFFPVDTLMTIIGVILAIEFAIVGWKVFTWVLRRFPTQS